jgi:hypothetical protein
MDVRIEGLISLFDLFGDLLLKFNHKLTSDEKLVLIMTCFSQHVEKIDMFELKRNVTVFLKKIDIRDVWVRDFICYSVDAWVRASLERDKRALKVKLFKEKMGGKCIASAVAK